jgi:glycosyltransferase involved in cell wall biosynthesis
VNRQRDKRPDGTTPDVAVLYLTANRNRASSNVSTEGWFRLLPQRGLRPVLVSSSAGAFHDWAGLQSIPSYVMPLPSPDKWRPWKYLATLTKLLGIVLRFKIQLVHAIEENVYPIAADLARLCRLPVIVGVHCRIERGFSAWAFGGRRQPDRLFFLSDGSRNVCCQAVDGVVDKASWRLLRNGLDIDSFRPDSAAGEQFRRDHGLGNQVLVGAASWLRPGKQLEHLFLIATRIDPSVSVVLAGGVAPGEEAYAKELLASGNQMLRNRLRFVGCLNDLRGYYNALDLYINTSKEETCSISIIEALACGCPVIGYPSVSVAEQVLPDGGEIVAQDNCDQLTDVLNRWLNDCARRQIAKNGARRRAENAFDIRTISDQLWREYQEVLGYSSHDSGELASQITPAMSKA